MKPYQRIKFDKAIEWFRDKLSIPTTTYDEIVNKAQEYAFTIAQVEKATILDKVRSKIFSVLGGRTKGVDTFGEFASAFRDIMTQGGYGTKSSRASLVYRNNVRSAYAAGRWQQIQESPNEYVQWWHDHPITPRPHHLALHQRVFRKDDPILKIIAPPSGHGCTCKLLSLSSRDIARERLQVSTIADTVTVRDKKTGEEFDIPAVRVDGNLIPISDPGWYNAPGSGGDRQQVLESAIERLPTRLRNKVLARIQKK